MTWVVCVSMTDLNDDEDDTEDLYGPFRTQETAKAFGDRVRAAIPRHADDSNASIAVWVRPVQPPRVRVAQRLAKSFIEDVNEQPDPVSWAYG